MKQAIIELKKKLLLVELQEGAKYIGVESNDIVYSMTFSGIPNVRHFTKLNFSVKEIGKLTDITEEQFKRLDIIETKPYLDHPFFCTLDYRYKGKYENGFNPGFCYDSGKQYTQSFFSKLESEGITFNRFSAKTSRGALITQGFTLDQQQEAQEKVWNLDNIYLFEII